MYTFVCAYAYSYMYRTAQPIVYISMVQVSTNSRVGQITPLQDTGAERGGGGRAFTPNFTVQLY